MTKPRIHSFLLVASLSILVVALVGAALAGEKRPFTVRDSVEMSYFGTVAESSPKYSYHDGAASPDDLYLVQMSHRGTIPEGVTEGTIWLFKTSDVLKSINDRDASAPVPSVLVRMSAEINGYTADFYERGNILFQLMWSDDSRYLYFMGRDGQENRQLFRVNVQTNVLEPLSLRNQDVMTYRLSGKSVAYLAGPAVNTNDDWVSAGRDIPDIVVGAGTPLLPLLYPNFRGYAISNPIELEAWTMQGGVSEPIVNISTGEALHITASFQEVGPSASLDGAHLLLTDELLEDTNWTASGTASPKTESSIQLTISESLNQPPVLIATDVDTGQSKTIFDPNPKLSDIAMAAVRIYEWHDAHGQTIHGGLVTPPDMVPGRRYPLVIQTHGFHRDRFFRVGYSDTANAGRALAGREIVVLQVEEPWSDEEQPWRDLPRLGLDAYLSAIDKLAEDGIIDPHKVGITGYSASGLLATASLTNAPDRFAAALIANSDPLTITGYSSYVDSPVQGVTELLLGATPYGEGLKDWLELSPAMSTEKIRAPVLIFASDPWHLLSLWDIYAALRYQEKPVELHYIRTGKHNINKPLHKMSHQELLVEWFDFWLNGNEYANPEKAEQYRRWRELRDGIQQTENDSSSQ